MLDHLKIAVMIVKFWNDMKLKVKLTQSDHQKQIDIDRKEFPKKGNKQP